MGGRGVRRNIMGGRIMYVVVGAVKRKGKKTLKEVIICQKEEDIQTTEEEIAGFSCRSREKASPGQTRTREYCCVPGIQESTMFHYSDEITRSNLNNTLSQMYSKQCVRDILSTRAHEYDWIV